MIDDLRRRVAGALSDAVEHLTGQRPQPAPEIQDPPRPEMGDLACAVALQVSRQIGRNPRELAQELVSRLTEHPVAGVVEWTIAGPGFLNARLDRAAFLLQLVEATRNESAVAVADKILVEHTSINPNKAAHIGHLRNSCMGDTLARVFRRLGHEVEVHNYIDDTGVQVADVVIGFLDVEGMSAAEVAALPEPFDYRCWDLYTLVSTRMASEPALQERRREVLLALEEDAGIEAEMARVISQRIVARHILTMARLDIEYDLLVKEGDVLALDLWSEAFERLKGSPSVFRPDEGKHADCWMMHLSGVEGFESLEEADKVLVRSNGVATYVAKDIAYHLWKYGLLDRTFGYEQVPDIGAGRQPVWQTCVTGGETLPFGNADRAVTVIDVRQSYLQAVVAQAFVLIGAEDAARSLTHFAYEMVALSPRTAIALGIPVDEDASTKQFVEMSGRRGYGVKADDLLDEMERRACEEVAARNPDLSLAEQQRTGRQITVGAVRYFLLRFTRNTVIVFDLEEALAFEGETGPYLQYAGVRASHIFDRLREQTGLDADLVVEQMLAGEAPEGVSREMVAARLAADDGQLWSLILALGRLDEVVVQSAKNLELSSLAKYAFSLAQHFNRFYHGYPIVQAEDPVDRVLRILVADAFRRQLGAVLSILGIPIPDRM